MVELDQLTLLGQEALLLALALSLPIVGIAAFAGLVVAVFQAATQVQDFTLAHLPRLIVVSLALALLAPWLGSELCAFAERAFLAG
jgi:type III secretion HrpO family protein